MSAAAAAAVGTSPQGSPRPVQLGLPPTRTREYSPAEQTLINEKVARVYGYTAAAFAVACTSAFAWAKLGVAVTLINTLGTWGGAAALLAVGISLIVATRFTNKEQTAQKHGLYGAFAVWEGLVLSPLVLMNAPAFIAAGVTTVAVTGSLGFLAMKMKQTFEKYERILLLGLGGIAAASLGAVLFKGVVGAIAHKVSMVGGTALFSAFVIYDTHKARSVALRTDFDEIDHSMSLFLNAMNLLVRFWHLYNRRQA